MDELYKKISHVSPTKIILFGYCIIIFIGAILLCLPISSKGGYTSFSDALFTATSATCVTGLIRFDTYTHWSLFGQVVILLLIQTGGIGFMTLAIALMSATRHKIGLSPRVIMQNSISAPQIGGIVRMTKFIMVGTFIVEAAGAFLLSFYFCGRFGFAKGLWFSVFHSVSAFCNAGFDLMGSVEPLSSITTINDVYYVNIVIMLLIFLGGLGFFVWKDVLNSRFSFKKMSLQSKIVISTSVVLVVIGALGIFIIELGGKAFEGMGLGQSVIASFFQSVTSRTAGFNSVDLASLREASLFVMICLMIVGGSTGSTAGGIKTTTFAALILSVAATVRRRKYCEIFGRRLEDSLLSTVSCIFIIYILLSVVSAIIISAWDGFTMLESLYETVSAIATVGVTLGITTELSFAPKILIIILMIIGRVGSITVLLALASPKSVVNAKFPVEKIQVG